MRQSILMLSAAAILTATSAQSEPVSYTIDPRHTFVTFEIGHLGISTNRGRWDRKEGTVQLDKTMKTGKIDIVIDLASINTGTEAFDKNLRSPNFFNTDVNKSAHFSSDQIVFSGDKVTEAIGKLTMMGQTHPLTLKARHFNCVMNNMLKRETCGGDFEAILDRTLYGISNSIGSVSKDVRLVIQVEAIQN